MEKIPNINSNIEKIRTLEECINELIIFQLEYIEKVDKDLIKIPNTNNSKEKFPNNFLKILTDHTSIEGYLEDEYLKRLSNPEDRKKDDFNYKKGYFVRGVMSQIYELYLEGNDNWKSRAIG